MGGQVKLTGRTEPGLQIVGFISRCWVNTRSTAGVLNDYLVGTGYGASGAYCFTLHTPATTFSLEDGYSFIN